MLTCFNITQQGESHITKDRPCQDFSDVKRVHADMLQVDFIVAAIADGVGCCAYSQIGSETAVKSVLETLVKGIENLKEVNDADMLKILQDGFRDALCRVEHTAEEMELPFTEFDSTLTAAVYDGMHLWFGHIGDDGIVALYSDGTYEMITSRHKGEEAHTLYPLRNRELWQFGLTHKQTVSAVLMTDGVLDYCVDQEGMHNRVYFPFLQPALTEQIVNDEQAQEYRKDWEAYLSGEDTSYPVRFRDAVSDDITFVLLQNPELVKQLPDIHFDTEKWEEDSKRRKKEIEEALYAEYYAHKEKKKGQVKQTDEVRNACEDAVHAACDLADSTVKLGRALGTYMYREYNVWKEQNREKRKDSLNDTEQ